MCRLAGSLVNSGTAVGCALAGPPRGRRENRPTGQRPWKVRMICDPPDAPAPMTLDVPV